MTMQVNSKQTLAGVSVLDLRRFFRQLVAHHQNSFNKKWLLKELQLTHSQTDGVLEELATQGYLSLAPSQHQAPEYRMTDLAHELVRSSAAKRISRTTAQDALEGLMLRAENLNANSKYLYSVCSVVVFGSYLSSNERLGDLDVAIELSPRIADPDERTDAYLQYAQDSGRHFSNFTEVLYWAEAEIYLVLKARRRTLSIQPWYSFLRMEKKNGFQYKVVMGDADKIARDLKGAEDKRQRDMLIGEQHGAPTSTSAKMG
jgi:predicted nucleotidyltransferase